MSDIHVLEKLGPDRFRVVLHIDIPAGNNSVGVPWRSAVVKSRVDALKPSVLPDGDGTAGTISIAEKAQLVSGERFEIVTVEKGQTVASLSETYNRRKNDALSDFQFELAQYGRTI